MGDLIKMMEWVFIYEKKKKNDLKSNSKIYKSPSQKKLLISAPSSNKKK